MLPFWNMDVMENVTFEVFISHSQYKAFFGQLLFSMGVSLSNFVDVRFLFTYMYPKMSTAKPQLARVFVHFDYPCFVRVQMLSTKSGFESWLY